MEEVVSMVIPFVTLSILSILIDRVVITLEFILHGIKGLPDSIEPGIAYILALAISIVICYYGHFDFFSYLDLNFPYDMGVILTGVIVSQGSSYLRTAFGAINEMPSAVSGVMSSLKSLFRK